MNTQKKPILTNLVILTGTTLFCFLFILFAMQITPTAKATPTPTPTPTPTCTVTPTITPVPGCTPNVQACGSCSVYPSPTTSPIPTAIPSAFQPPLPDTTVLEWRVFPPATGGPTWPVAVVIHEGGFKTGNVFSHLLDDPITDLTADGYYTFVVAYRLAPCGLVRGQACHTDPLSGRPLEQTNDIKAFVRAARADIHCNGKVAVVGGSAGGSHAAFVALDTTSSTGWPNWTSADRPDVAAGLSGAYNFAGRTPESYLPDPVPGFVQLIENYTNSCDPRDQRPLGPVAKVTTPTISKPFRPMYLISSEYDPMPYHQIIDMQCALQGAGVNSSLYQVETIPGSNEHAFEYWRTWDGVSGPLAHDWGYHVISFLDKYLK